MRHPASVLVVSCLDDPTADRVLGELCDRDIPVARLDPGADFPSLMKLKASIDAEGLEGSILTRTRCLDLTGVRSVYWRQPTPYGPQKQLAANVGQWVADQSRFGLGGVLAALPGARYLNHPWRNRDAEYKPVQLVTAAACGLNVPRTLITNDLECARTFAWQGDGVVYKPLWSTPYRGGDGVARTVWTDTIEPDALDERVAGAAHLLQERVKKVADIRVTMVGDRVFPVRIDGAPRLDWRLDYALLTYTAIEAPPSVVAGMRAYLDTFRLDFGAFDFSLTEAGQWVFLECNPNGQWGWFDESIAHQIAAAIAEWLIRPEGPR